jgi:quinol monooxygenase YgiN
MIQVIWEFVVKRGCVDRFERAYGPDGAWARLFMAHPGFRGTTLLRDEDNPRRYLTIDSWDTEAHRERMLTNAKARYSDLDEALADLTESEDEIGTFIGRTIPTSHPASSASPRKPPGVRRASRRTRG